MTRPGARTRCVAGTPKRASNVARALDSPRSAASGRVDGRATSPADRRAAATKIQSLGPLAAKRVANLLPTGEIQALVLRIVVQPTPNRQHDPGAIGELIDKQRTRPMFVGGGNRLSRQSLCFDPVDEVKRSSTQPAEERLAVGLIARNCSEVELL